MQSCAQFVQATDTSITMLLRLCKRSVTACEWVKLNKDRLKWMDAYLTSRKGGGYPHGSSLLKTKRGAGAAGRPGGYHGSSQAGTGAVLSPTVIAAANLSMLKFVMANGAHRGIAGATSYDSDDDPQELVGEWSGCVWC